MQIDEFHRRILAMEGVENRTFLTELGDVLHMLYFGYLTSGIFKSMMVLPIPFAVVGMIGKQPPDLETYLGMIGFLVVVGTFFFLMAMLAKSKGPDFKKLVAMNDSPAMASALTALALVDPDLAKELTAQVRGYLGATNPQRVECA